MSWIGAIGSTAGMRIWSVGMMCAAAIAGLDTPVRLSAFFRIVSCWSTRVSATVSSCSPDATSASARTTSMGARVPTSTCFCCPRNSCWRPASASLGHAHVFVESHQVPVEVHHGGDGGVHLELEGEVGHLAVVPGDPDLARIDSRAEPCNRCWVMERPSEELVDGLKSLRGLLLVTELLLSPRLTVVPVRKPFWIAEIARCPAADQGVGAGDEGAGLRRGGVGPAQRCR